MRECLGSSPAAEQRGADSCVTYILGACSTHWDNNGLDWEECVWMGGNG